MRDLKNGCTNVHDEEQSRTPSTQTDEISQQADHKLRSDKQLTINDLADKFPLAGQDCHRKAQVSCVQNGYSKCLPSSIKSKECQVDECLWAVANKMEMSRFPTLLWATRCVYPTAIQK